MVDALVLTPFQKAKRRFQVSHPAEQLLRLAEQVDLLEMKFKKLSEMVKELKAKKKGKKSEVS